MPTALIEIGAGTYDTDIDGTPGTVTVPALTSGSIDQATPSIGDTLTVTGSNASSTATYQWQESADGSTGWTNISGATAASLDTSSGVTDDYFVRRQVSDGAQGPVSTTGVEVSAAAAGYTTPDASANTIAWYESQDSATVTVAGSDITAVSDKVGSQDLAVTAAQTAPTYNSGTPDGFAYTAGVSGGLETGDTFPIPADGDFIVSLSCTVSAVDNNFNGLIAMRDPATTNDWQLVANNASNFLGQLDARGISSDGGTEIFSPTPLATDEVVSIAFDFSGVLGTANRIYIYRGGSLVDTITDYNTKVPTAVRLVLGSIRAGSDSFGGSFYECVVSSDLSERADIESYLTGNLA